MAAMPVMAGSSNSGQQQSGMSSSNGQMQGQMQNGGQQMQGRTQQNSRQEPPKPGFKVTVQHSGDRKTVGNYSSGRTQRSAPAVDPASKPFRTMADMAHHNRKIEACLAFCSISHKNWETECITKAGPQYPCGSLGASWYYQCQHNCANGK